MDLEALWVGEPDDGSRPDEFAAAQQPDAQGPRDFIAALRDAALATDALTGIPAGFTIAQAALETGWGRYVPRDIDTGRYSYNLFGVKALPGQDAVTSWTWEHDAAGWHRVQARFRAYASYQESIDDHARLLTTPRYAGCLPASDAATYARCVHAAGYATDPQYADKLISIMRTWGILDLWAARPEPLAGLPAVRVMVGGRAVTGVLVKGQTWAPIRPVAEALGAAVEWDGVNRTVRITRP